MTTQEAQPSDSMTSAVPDIINHETLELQTMIGFCGSVPFGLQCHPNRQHLVYPIGCTVVIEDIQTKEQVFLSGHTNSVSTLAISQDGRYIASGQTTYMGYKADIIVWDFESRRELYKLVLHMVKIEDLCFSCNSKYLISLGGEDDGSVVVWNMQNGQAVCGSPAQVPSAGVTHKICCGNTCDDLFITAGNGTLRVWQLDLANRKIRPTDVSMGQVKRVVKCIAMAEDDSFFYCGTTTGDIFAVNMSSTRFQKIGPEKQRFGLGINCLKLLTTGDMLVGSGDGTICVTKGMDQNFKRTNKCEKLEHAGGITSLALRGQGHQFFVGTERGQMYRINMADFKAELATTCHYAAINDCTFPMHCGELFLTCSYETIRVWLSKGGCKELLRICNPNKTCHTVEVSPDGKAIVSGWDDGRINGYTSQTGKPIFSITDAHKGGVTALQVAQNNPQIAAGGYIVSGGREGGIRVWSYDRTYVQGKSQPVYIAKLLFALKEHNAMVTCIQLSSDSSKCVSSSTDGSCIVWNLAKRCRENMVHVNTLFQYVCFFPEQVSIGGEAQFKETQFITTGSDHKISYYETYDGSLIREIDGAKTGSINCLDISQNGKYIVSGGQDRLIRVWLYDEGEVVRIGAGHSAPITRAKFSPCGTYILSVSIDGAILMWRFYSSN